MVAEEEIDVVGVRNSGDTVVDVRHATRGSKTGPARAPRCSCRLQPSLVGLIPSGRVTECLC